MFNEYFKEYKYSFKLLEDLLFTVLKVLTQNAIFSLLLNYFNKKR